MHQPGCASVISAEGQRPDTEECIWRDPVYVKFKNRQPRSLVSDVRVGWQGGDWRGCRGRGWGAGNILCLGLAAGYNRCVDFYDLLFCYSYAIFQKKCLLTIIPMPGQHLQRSCFNWSG